MFNGTFSKIGYIVVMAYGREQTQQNNKINRKNTKVLFYPILRVSLDYMH